MKKNLIPNLTLFLLLSNAILAPVYAKADPASKKSGNGFLGHISWPTSFKSPFGGNVTETVSYQKEVSPNVALSVTNVNGEVTIKTWKNNSVLLDAVKKGKKEDVAATKIAFHKDGNSLSISTVGSDDKRKPCTVHYTLLVPENCRLESVATESGKINIHNIQNKIVAHTHNGRIEMNNVSGTIETSTKRGEIVINTNTIIPDTRIFAFSEQGKINLSVPKKTNAVLTAETKQGKIESTVSITTSPQTMKFNNKTFAQLKQKADGTLGKGGSASIKLHTNKGNIVLHEV